MRACFGVGHRYVGYAVDGEGVVEGAVVAENPAMAMGGVFAEADIGDDEEGREAGPEEADGLDDGAVGVVGCGAESVFDVRSDGNAEEYYGTEAFANKRVEMRGEFMEAAAVLVGKGGDKGFFFGLVGYEERIDEHGLIVQCQHVDLSNISKYMTLVNCLSACHDLANGWL